MSNDASGSMDAEQENISLMISMMGGSIDDVEARRVLKESNGDLNKAMNALFEPSASHSRSQSAISEEREKHNNTPGSSFRKHETSDARNVIDLTADDHGDDLTRALQASLEPLIHLQEFNSSVRAPHPDWAVVSSNVQAAPVSQDDHSLSRAIEASLSSSSEESSVDKYEALDIHETVRQGNRPVALRPLHPKHAYAALVVQGLFALEELRRRIASLRYPPEDILESDSLIAALQRLFVNMDLSRLSLLSAEEFIKIFRITSWSSLRERPRELTYSFMQRAIIAIESHLCQQNDDKPVRLFRFSHARLDVNDDNAPLLQDETEIVQVDNNPDNLNSPNDLVSRLTSQLAQQWTILEPSHIVVFHLSPSTHPALPDGQTRKNFRYPRSFYLDQFLYENVHLVRRKRDQQQIILEEIRKSNLQKKAITHLNNKDTLGDLRASIYYYENVANAEGNSERVAAVKKSKEKLETILNALERQVESMDQTIANLAVDSKTLFDVPELQKHKYDLRVVLSHDGLYGPKNLYSYVKQNEVWWKTVDYQVTQVSEEAVLEDTNGVHLGAGPHVLMYCRSIDNTNQVPITWPKELEEEVSRNNEQFLEFIAKGQSSVLLPAQIPVQADSRLPEEPMDESNG